MNLIGDISKKTNLVAVIENDVRLLVDHAHRTLSVHVDLLKSGGYAGQMGELDRILSSKMLGSFKDVQEQR